MQKLRDQCLGLRDFESRLRVASKYARTAGLPKYVTNSSMGFILYFPFVIYIFLIYRYIL